MRYFKIADENYIYSVGKGNVGIEITEQEYNTIISALDSKPARTETVWHKLRTDLTWEAFQVSIPDDNTPILDSEALNILLGSENGGDDA